MSNNKPKLDSLFEAAAQIQSPDERAAFLDQSCGTDDTLRQQLEQLLESDRQAGEFLETPPEGVAAKARHREPGDGPRASSEEQRTPAFGKKELPAGNAGHSVLQMLGQTIDVPRVALRESDVEGAGPIQRLDSPELPDRGHGSRYQLHGEIARGGMGAILKGRDTDLGRDLAIKVLLDSHKDNPEVLQRFVEEAQIGGQLQHPGIAPVYELGQFADARPFFSMKLVKGKTLSNLLADREDLAERRGRFIGIFEQVCQTMGYAHSRGVIHRDLKPSNIMVGAFGEVQVMDWGLAKVLATGGVADEKKTQLKQQGHSIIQTLRAAGSDTPDGVGSQTQMGSVMGTPAYMAPEQALGEIDNMDERADVFGLGAMLCEILTGKPPYVSDDGTRVYRLASRGKLEGCFERLDSCGADAELIVLTKHCLEVEPDDRPRDAGVIAQRVSEYVKSVETRLRETELASVEAQARAEELGRRRKLLYAIAGMLLVALITAGLAATHFHSQEQRQRTLSKSNAKLAEEREAERISAVAARRLAVAARDEYRELLYSADMSIAEQAWRDGNVERVIQLLRRHVPQSGQQDLRGFEWYYFWGICQRSHHTPIFDVEIPHPGPISLRFSADATQVIAHKRRLGGVSICDLATGEQIRVQDLIGDSPREVWYFVSGNGHFATWNEDHSLSLWKAEDHQYERVADFDERFPSIDDISLSPDLKTLAVRIADSQKIDLWDVEKREIRSELDLKENPARVLMFSPDSRHLAVRAGTNNIQIWEVETGRLRHTFLHEGVFPAGSFSPDGTSLVSWTARPECELAVWSIETGDRADLLDGHSRKIHSAAFSPDGRTIGSTSLDHSVVLWDVETRQPRHTLMGHSNWPWAIAFSPNGELVATGGADNAIILWDTVTGEIVDTLKGHPTWIHHIAFSPDGKRLASADNMDNIVKVWNIEKRPAPHEIEAHERTTIDAVVISPNGQLAATAGRDDKVRVWDLTSGERLHEFHAESFIYPGNPVLSLSPDGKTLAVAVGPDVKVWDVETGELKATHSQPGAMIFCVAYSPLGGDHLAAGRIDGTVDLWDTSTGIRIKEFQADFRRVESVRFGLDGQTLAAVTRGGILAVWNLDDFHQLYTCDLETSGTASLSLSHSGELAVAAREEGVLILQDGRIVDRLATHSGLVLSLAYVPGKSQLVTASLDRTIKRWDINQRTGRRTEQHSFTGHTVGVLSVAISADGRTIVSADDDGFLQIRRAASEADVEATDW